MARLNGAIVGHLTFVYRHVESDKQMTRDVLFADDLTVMEGYRGRGIGSALLNAAKKIVREENLDGLELQVNARNQPAREMYKKLDLQRSPSIWSCCKNGDPGISSCILKVFSV